MRGAIAILIFGVLSTTVAEDEPPEILIVPRSVHLPSSGRAVFDVYWHNWASKPAVIPALDTCYFSWWAIVSGQPSGERRASRVIVDDRAPARPIAPSAVVHDTLTGTLQLNPGEIAQVSLRANQDDGKILESNIVVFAITPAISQDKIEDGGPFAGAEIQLMRHAEAVYIFPVKKNSPETPNQKDLRRLGPEARQALVDTLCNLDNWNFVTGGSEDCEPHDVGLLFQNSKDRLILRFCSVCDPHIGCGVDKTPGRISNGGWIKQQPWESWKRRFAQLEMRK